MSSPRSPRRRRHALVGLGRNVLLPGELRSVDLRHANDRRALQHAEQEEGHCVAIPLASAGSNAPELPRIGTLARIVSRPSSSSEPPRVVLEGLERVCLSKPSYEEGCLWVQVEAPATPAPEAHPDSSRILARLEAMVASAHRWKGDGIAELGGSDQVTDRAAALLPLGHADRASLLAEADPLQRALMLDRLIAADLSRFGSPETRPAEGEAPERLDHLRSSIGKGLPHAAEALRLERRIRTTALSPQARCAALRELDHLRRAAPSSTDATRTRNYLEWMLELPWPRESRAPETLLPHTFEHARQVLARAHIGLEDVKERIAEFLAVRLLGGGARGTVLCFAGPPGTGKSSMGRAVASALHRRVLTIPVGAMTHEREIVGISHRRESGMPGAILSGLHRCSSENPVILLDEIDKLRLGGEGTSAGALLQLLDPEQNAEFFDHYLSVPFDLSRCLLLATAIDPDAIPEALLDRMEVIEFNGFTDSEKVEIARHHLLPRAREHAGVDGRQFRISSAALHAVIQGHTEEAGVRQLQRHLIALARKAAVRVVRDGQGLSVCKGNLVGLLGPRTSEDDLRRRSNAVGVATGLAWTSAGGALLPIEALAMPGAGRMILTGQIGDVLRESVQTALSYVRTRFRALELEPDVLDSLDIHLHFPSAATPKDGPSAGIAIVTALVSLLSSRPSRHDVAMSGEVSLLGSVLPVGGLRDKLLAAIRARIPRVVVPARNADEVMRLSPEIKSRLSIHLIESAAEALDLALLRGRASGSRARAGSVRKTRPARAGKKSRKRG